MTVRAHQQTAASMAVVLAARNLEKEFLAKKGVVVQALRRVSLTVRPRQITGLVGADGAGKTTLIRMAAGLTVPTAGAVTVLGLDSVVDTVKIQSLIGYMPQKFGLYQDLTVKENLDLYAELQGVPPSQRQDRYGRLLQMTGLEPFTRRLAGALSGGMKQKLGLACALIKSPQMLLLDEPTVGVDPISRRELWKIVYELVATDGIGVLLSTAYLDEAERCDYVVVLHEGEKLAEGTPREFKRRLEQKVALVEPSTDIKARQIHTHLIGKEHIVDATIRSGKVRVVTAAAGTQAVADALPKEWGASVKGTSPTFEDAFMALIPHQGSHVQINNKTDPSDKKILKKEVMVQTKALYKSFGDFAAVKGLSFRVYHGEIFGLLGPNGAGKSTTFRMLCGLLSASSGEIDVAGHDLRNSPSRARARLGYMAQHFSLYGQLSVQENLTFFGKAYGLVGKRLRFRIAWAFEEFGLGKWRDKAAVLLPGGYKQRLSMAAALLHEPEILFLDEPTSGVDPLARREFWLRINGFAEQGVTVVVTTHFMEESEYCDRMLIMSQGENLAMGTPYEIRMLARSEENPEPTIEDAFIALAQGKIAPKEAESFREKGRGEK